MTQRKNPLNNKIMLEEELLSEHDDFLPSVLSMINGYCKVNLEVPQTSAFYSSLSLLPINAKVNSTILNNTIQKSKINNSPDIIADMLKNVNSIADDTIDEKSVSDKISFNKLQEHSKPSYPDNTNQLSVKEDTKTTISPKGRKKKNKFSKVETASASTSDNQTQVLSHRSDQNSSTGYYNQWKTMENNGRSNERLRIKQEQELKKRQLRYMKNYVNNTLPSRNRPSLSRPKSENEIQNNNLSPQSQCPLCFELYPTPDIEVHASECSI